MNGHQPSAAPTAPQTLYQTLLSVNSVVGKSEFQASDRKAAQDRYATIFMQNKVGDSIYDAIAAKSGSEAVGGKLIAETCIPRDFILDKKKLTHSELVARMTVAGRQIYNKELPTPDDIEKGNPASLPPLAEGVDGEADFELRTSELRLMLIDMGLPRIKAVWLARFHQSLQSEEYKNVKGVEDFLVVIKTRTYNNARRRDIDIANNKMLGNLSCFTEIERVVMKNAKLKYTDKLVDGTTCKTKRQHGSIKSMYVRLRQTYFSDLIRHATFMAHLEVLYHRRLKNPQDGVVAVVKVTVASHGFNGYLGYGPGHPDLLKIAKLDDAISKKPVDSEAQLLEYLQDQLKAGTKKTTAELLEEWNKRPKKAVVAVVSITSDQTSAVSPMTESSDLESAATSGDESTATTESTAQDFSVDLEPYAARKTPTPKKTPSPVHPAEDRPKEAPIVRKEAPIVRKEAQIVRKEAPTKQLKKKAQRKRLAVQNGAKSIKRKAGAKPIPSTPTKKARQTSPPSSPEYETMENGRQRKICKHHKLKDFRGCERDWFSDKRRKLVNHPVQCAEVTCKKLLVESMKGRDPKKYYAGKAYTCDNAINHRDHECIFAYCTPCFEIKNLGQQPEVKEGDKPPVRATGRKRKAVVRLQPGERKLANGDIVAA